LTRANERCAALVLAGFALGCINVGALQVTTDGGFSCEPSNPAGCPTGFTCDSKTATCTSDARDGATDTSNPDASFDVGGACVAPIPGCTPDPHFTPCDPSCQMVCSCGKKCSVNTLGSPTCNALAGDVPRYEGESCTQVSAGTAAQTDDCVAGTLCLNESCGNTCVRLCRTDDDCPLSKCTLALTGTFKACDVAAIACNPVRALGASQCPEAAQGCYLSADVADRTICDCPRGSNSVGAACTDSRDCQSGLVCADSTGAGEPRCQPACSLTATPNGCPSTQSCHALKGSKKFGYCAEGSPGAIGLGEICVPGTGDNCAAGLICLQEACGNGLGRCYRHCATNDQCGSSLCQVPIVDSQGADTGLEACDVAPRVCDPITNTGCPSSAFNCYYTSVDQTVCDCPTGTGKAGDRCVIYSDCAAGLVCVAGGTGISTPQCLIACQTASPSCPTNTRCVAIAAGAKYGYCGG
jgi:hypothetical protein